MVGNSSVMGASIPQVAAIPFRKCGKRRFEFLLITTPRLGWAIPKGHLERGVKPKRMASIEAREEAGAIGEVVGSSLGTFTYRKSSGIAVVKVFPLKVRKVLSQWEEQHRRRRRWLDAQRAIDRVDHPQIARLIRRLARQLRDEA